MHAGNIQRNIPCPQAGHGNGWVLLGIAMGLRKGGAVVKIVI